MKNQIYTTQMNAARNGIITPQLEIVAKKEKMTIQELMPLVACGKVCHSCKQKPYSIRP